MSCAFVLLIHQDNLFTLNWIINTWNYDIFMFIQACILSNSFCNNNLVNCAARKNYKQKEN